ncbi:MAG: DNA-binding transcriptional LysR family regulator [Gammaproteobacteria bacterium]|jgi:DNA-binding transcriptional LysR family regulator
MASSQLDIESMRALTVIVDSGGITSAAKKLNLSQSAVSHKMKRLEAKLNRALFSRVDGKLSLSFDGEKLLDYARRLVKLHDEALASFHQSDLVGKLKLGITEDVTASGIAKILSNFSINFPNINLTSSVSHTPQLIRWLDSGDIDMALIEVFESERLTTDHALGQQKIVWLQAEDFSLDTDAPIPFVTYHKDCFYRAWAERALARRGQSLRVVFECPSVEGMINAVRNGLGIGLVNNDALELRSLNRHNGNRGLTIERKNLPQPPAIQHVARLSTGTTTRQMTKLLELIKAELRPRKSGKKS